MASACRYTFTMRTFDEWNIIRSSLNEEVSVAFIAAVPVRFVVAISGPILLGAGSELAVLVN